MRPEITHIDRQSTIAAALLDATLPPPVGLVAPGGGPVGRRFAVHRATSTLGTIAALATRHPVLERLLGTETFATLARAFLAVDRPRSALLLGWGDGLPDFVAAHPDLADWPWLADVARLEVAWIRAHHAADATPLGLTDLARLDAESLAACRIVLHPSLETLASPWPVATLWEAKGEAIDFAAEAERMVIVRPEADVHVHRTSAAGLAFVEALAAGADLTTAAGNAATLEPDFDAGTHLVGLVRLGAVVAVLPPDEAEETAP